MTMFFDNVTGQLSSRTFTGSSKLLKLNTPAGHSPIEGEFDRETQRVDVAALKAARGDFSPPSDFVVERDDAAEMRERALAEQKDQTARALLLELDLRSVRRLRELSTDPDLVAIEEQAAELRNDVIRTPAEQVEADPLP